MMPFVIAAPTRALLRALVSRYAREEMQRHWYAERGKMWPDPTDANDEAILHAVIDVLEQRIDSGGRAT